MPPRRKAETPQYKKALRRKITIEIEADEETLNRLATVLMFARPPLDKIKYEDPPLPWPLGDEDKPEEAELYRIPEEEVRADIAQRVPFLAKQSGIEFVKAMLTEYGVANVAALEGEQLRRFHADLVRSTPKYAM